jgi:putative drug exporter of the RND superfamily
MIRSLARAVSGRRSKWVVIAVWIGLLVAFTPASMTLSEVTTDETATADSLPEDSESARLAEEIGDRFPGGESLLALVVYTRAGGLSAADRATIQADAAQARRVEGVGRVVPPFGPGSTPGLVSRSGEVAFIAVPLTSDKSEERTDAVKELRDIGKGGARGMQVRVTGAAALQSDLTTTLEQTDAALLLATAGLVLVLLIVIYRSPLIAILPLVVVGVSYTIATGIVHLGAEATGATVDRTAVTLLAILMFGAGTDYCLLLVARYSTELRETDDKHDAIGRALVRAGPAIAASGCVVAGALLTLLVARTNSTQIFGPVNATGILVGLAASLTLLPALLAVAGRTGFWPSRKLVTPQQRRQAVLHPTLGALPDFKSDPMDLHPAVRQRDPIWRKVGTAALKRPVVTLLACGAVLVVCALGVTQYTPEIDVIGQFRKTTDSTEGFKQLREGFPAGTLYPNTVLVDRPGAPLRPGDVEAARRAVSGIDGVALVSGPTATSSDRRAATFVATFADDPFKDPALDRVEVMRERLRAAGDAAGFTPLVGDGTALRLDYKDSLASDQKRVVPLVLVVITLTLAVLLRAIVAPLYLIATVVLSFLATLGISLTVFDKVFGEPRVDPAFPVLAFIFLVALGVDYNIFLMDRVREESRAHGTREGVLRALVATGPVITSAGIVLAGTFAVLMTLPLDILLELGFAVALGVLIDTFLVRTLLVPALVELVGDASWWPSRLRPAAPPPPPPQRPGPLLAPTPR